MEYLIFLRTHWDRLAGWSAVILGAAFVIIGWLGVSGTSYVFEQMPYIVSGGIGGLYLLGLGAALLLSADLRDEWNKLDAIEERLSMLPNEVGAEGPGRDSAPAEAAQPTATKRRRALRAGTHAAAGTHAGAGVMPDQQVALSRDDHALDR